jgi:O-antigen/teichoic acid export membrane protein
MIKKFFLNVSIYGVLPVFGKVLNFLLVFLYAKFFTPAEFGIIDLFETAAFFLLAITSFEIPTALGRFFYEETTTSHKKTIVSTGFYLTLLTTSITCLILIFCRDVILRNYSGDVDYYSLYWLALIWLFSMTVNTYLSFIPRYDNNPRRYVMVGMINNLIKLLLSLLFVVIMKLGIKGIFYGLISGSTISLLLYAIIYKKYIGLNFSFVYSQKILRYVLPLLPGVIIAGLWMPFLRFYMASSFPFIVLGYYAFASRLTSVNTILHGALVTAWTPFLFERKDELLDGENIKRISGLIFLLSIMLSISLTVFSPEATLLIGTNDYLEAVKLIAFVSFAGTIKIMTQIRGFGPYIKDKTQYISAAHIISLITCAAFLFLLRGHHSFYIIGVVVVLYELIIYLIQSSYTIKTCHVNPYYSWELILLIALIVSGLVIQAHLALLYRMVVFLVSFAIFLHIIRTTYHTTIAKVLKWR